MGNLQYDPDAGFLCGDRECPETGWCEHMETDVKLHYDAEVFWNFVEKFNQLWWPMKVPIVPSEGAFAFVKIARSNNKEPWAAFLVYDDPFIGDPHKAGSTHRLGTTGPGEGLMVWRSLIWDYFRSQIKPDHTKCTSRAHS
jgi:hypothetical protein